MHRSPWRPIAAALTLLLPITLGTNCLAADVALAWDPSPAATNYRLHSGTSSGVYTQITELGNSTSTLVSNLTVGQTYFFAVTAYNATSPESPPSNEISYVGGAPTPTPTPTPWPTATPTPTITPTPTPTGTPAAPSNLQASAISSNQVTLSWKSNSTNQTGFNIDRSKGGGAYSQIGTVAGSLTTYSNTGLSASTTYNYRVRAYNTSGSSGYSNTASAKTMSSTPTPTPTPTPTATPSASPTPSPTPSATPIITVSVSPTSVHEGGIATFTITASVPNSTAPITVNYAMSGKAIYGTHYTLAGSNGTVTIPPGATSTTVNLRALITGLTKKSEKAIMTLQTSLDYKLPKSKSLKKATVTIQNIYP